MSNAAHVLVIAGTDSSGGAGLVRDVEVITELGARASCVVTAVTAQTNSRVEASCMVAPELVRLQLRTALRSNTVSAIKVGMLGTGEIVRAILDELPDRCHIPIVVDPVLRSTSGAALLDPEGLQLLRDRLLPRCSLMTPNLIEASALLGEHVARTDSEQAGQARALLRFGSDGVLLKGGHGTDADSVDVLVDHAGPPTLLRARRLDVTMRGTGCALSSAIAALMASGEPMESACQRAKSYVHDKLLTLSPVS
ncbi:hydroxymethylpyrimidine/phosphomethylpyrimidine kinase [Peristeroidobacter agariperforans]|uniref:hydroxymethylpyrimidine/phosphomethylpyrimidine kinase n=1 Tax=Peristeroidobacter agariperforans TaxID=268404 RepID=UPI00101CF75B|nr:hydroxymethylpyrimidine/phosphomethylpyrimidine kinase [Peristeroidobacter agariperforans]